MTQVKAVHGMNEREEVKWRWISAQWLCKKPWLTQPGAGIHSSRTLQNRTEIASKQQVLNKCRRVKGSAVTGVRMRQREGATESGRGSITRHKPTGNRTEQIHKYWKKIRRQAGQKELGAVHFLWVQICILIECVCWVETTLPYGLYMLLKTCVLLQTLKTLWSIINTIYWGS